MKLRYGKLEIVSSSDKRVLTLEVEASGEVSAARLSVAKHPMFGEGAEEKSVNISILRVFGNYHECDEFSREHKIFWDRFFTYPEPYLGYSRAGRLEAEDLYGRTWNIEEASLVSVSESERIGASVVFDYEFLIKDK